MSNDGLDEDQLLAVLRRVFAAEHQVPQSVVAQAEAAIWWRGIDAELELLFDSATSASAGRRAGPVARQVVFGGGGLTVECELTGAELAGQVLPPIAERVRLLAPSVGTDEILAVDPQGWFTIRPMPPGPLSLRLSVAGRTDLVTPWLWP